MFKRILVPVDDSDLSEKAIQISVSLAQQLGAAITGFIAEPLPPLVSGPRAPALVQQDMVEHDAMTDSHARAVLERFEARALAAGVPFEGYHDQVPQVSRAIITAAESRGCDLIVMATHGRGAFGEFLFGSETKAVLAGCKLPLLVVR